jgi:hypothetical protein
MRRGIARNQARLGNAILSFGRRLPPTEAALLLVDAPLVTHERVVSVNLAGKSRPAASEIFQSLGLGLTLRKFHQATTFRCLIEAVLCAVHELIPGDNDDQDMLWGYSKSQHSVALRRTHRGFLQPVRSQKWNRSQKPKRGHHHTLLMKKGGRSYFVLVLPTMV